MRYSEIIPLSMFYVDEKKIHKTIHLLKLIFMAQGENLYKFFMVKEGGSANKNLSLPNALHLIT
ncbi:Fumarate lyase (fragment) [Bartonella clarridgeiae 73]|uniref:Fumarate lyase n=1 Tax=Bartonella clarridgeiae (strain CCUG 45776 / CIP 104772 / 73) TaxID=696125 RepID=E6YHZ0_BARC7